MNRPRPIPVEKRRHSVASPWTYRALDMRQRDIARRVREGGTGTILLSEVAPVVTIGRRTQASDLALTAAGFAALGTEVYPVDRGGFATYHGPGQWVLFAVDQLEALVGDRRGVRRAVDGLLETALAVALEFEPAAEIRSGRETGVWCPRGKLASVGLHVEKRVVLHGLALNVRSTKSSFAGIRGCGLDAGPAYLKESAADAEFDKIGENLAAEALKRFWKTGTASLKEA